MQASKVTMQMPTLLPFARDRKSTRLNSSHGYISYAVFRLKKIIAHIGRYRNTSPRIAAHIPVVPVVTLLRCRGMANLAMLSPHVRPLQIDLVAANRTLPIK